MPARFNLEDYPSDSELQALGAKLIKLVPQLKQAKDESDEAKLKSLLEGVMIIQNSSELRLLLEIADVELVLKSTHWIESLNRGAIEIRDNAEENKVFIYVSRESGKWRMLACYTGWLSSTTILKD